MKKMIVKMAVCVGILLAGMAFAANPASDSAADEVYDSEWMNDMNGGTGFGAWQLSAGGDGGFFMGSSSGNAGGGSGNIDTGSRAWGLWSTNGVTEAIRSFTGGDLATGQVFRVSLDNGYLASARSAGIGLRNSSGETLWEFYFSGDDTFYTVRDGYGVNSSVVPYTGDGLQVEFALVGSTGWLARVSSGVKSWNMAGTLVSQSDMGIEQFRAWNYEAGGGSDYDVFINSLSISEGAVDLFSPSFPYEIVDTGTTNCYDASMTISAPTPGTSFAGQDAQYTGNEACYVLASGGKVVEDRVTGLMWQQSPDIDDDGDIDVDDKLTWAELQTYPAALNSGNFGGYNDWRLPSIKELYSLIDFRGTDPNVEGDDTTGLIPFINTDYFEFAYGDTANGERVIDSQYGSSNLYVSTSTEQLLFGVNFADGRIKGYGLRAFGGGDKTFSVMCVRGNPDYGYNRFVDDGDGTIRDLATGLTWQQADSGVGMNWEDALAYAEGLELGGYNDWRLPNVKKLHSILDYTRAPDTSSSAAIDPLFTCSVITNMNGVDDYAFYWSGTTHLGFDGNAARGCYVSFGRGLGTYDEGVTITDVHGAGCQRSDPKSGDPADYPNAGNGPQGDVSRVFNHVRCVRSATVSAPSADADNDGLSDWYEYNYVTNTTSMNAQDDGDDDGLSNLDEAGAGTSPVDAESCLEVTNVSGGDDSVVAWSSVCGIEYRLESSTNLAHASGWETVSSGILGVGAVNIHTDETAGAQSTVYYRVCID